MRILGFSREWGKLENPEFTTFRFPRRDKDWQFYEVVRIVLHPRRKGGGKFLGTARIEHIEPRHILDPNLGAIVAPAVDEEEAIADGFASLQDMRKWLITAYRESPLRRCPMNKLTLHWIRREVNYEKDGLR